MPLELLHFSSPKTLQALRLNPTSGHLTCPQIMPVNPKSALLVCPGRKLTCLLALKFTDVFMPDSAVLGKVGLGLPIAQTFVHENRLRQAASSLGAAEYCIEESIKYARKRKPFGKELSTNQSIQFPIVELSTQAAMLRLLILKTATEMDGITQKEIERGLGDKVSMCNV